MKKLLASALLAGIVLGTASPVFAATGAEGTATTGQSDVTSVVSATYSVTIPEDSSIDIMAGTKSTVKAVTISDLTTAGTVDVKATVTDLILAGDTTGDENKRLSTTITVVEDGETTLDQLSEFKLSNTTLTKDVTVTTDAETTNKFSGTYTGTIDFTFDYANPVNETVVE